MVALIAGSDASRHGWGASSPEGGNCPPLPGLVLSPTAPNPGPSAGGGRLAPGPQLLFPAGTAWHLGLGANGRPLNATIWFNLTPSATITGAFGTTQPWFAYGYFLTVAQWQQSNRPSIGLCAPWSACWTYESIRGTFNPSQSSNASQSQVVAATLPAGTWLLMFETTGSWHHQDVWITSPIVATYA